MHHKERVSTYGIGTPSFVNDGAAWRVTRGHDMLRDCYSLLSKKKSELACISRVSSNQGPGPIGRHHRQYPRKRGGLFDLRELDSACGG